MGMFQKSYGSHYITGVSLSVKYTLMGDLAAFDKRWPESKSQMKGLLWMLQQQAPMAHVKGIQVPYSFY